jgi:ribosomal 30S subunit maturation factor RimM
MRKMIVLIAAISLIAFGYTASMSAAQTWRTEGPYARWIDKPVYNLEGDELGTITQFVTDASGDILFAVLYGYDTGKNHEVPVSALSYNVDQEYLVLDIDRDRLASAPVYYEGEMYDEGTMNQISSYYEDTGSERLVMKRSERIVGGGSGFATSDVDHWIGKEVINQEGRNLGVITDFVRDEEDRMVFALVDNAKLDKRVAVPFSALSFDEGREYVALNMSEDRFADAPDFEDWSELTDRSYIEENYRYFGETPYWTERGIEDRGFRRELRTERDFGMQRAPQEPEIRGTVDEDIGFEGMKRAPQELEPEDY